MTQLSNVQVAEAAEIDAVVRVWRTDGDDSPGEFVTFHLKIGSDWSVLNVLQAIQREQEPGLSFYAACKLGLCTACWAQVNGKKVLTCTAPVEADMTIEPAKNYRVLRDVLIEPIDR